jgi:DNA repair protein RadC
MLFGKIMTREDLKGHRERLRQRFINNGIDGLHDYEAVELLLTFVIPRRDVKPLAKKLLAHFKGFSELFDASYEELCEVPGIGENTAVLFCTIKQICSGYLDGYMRGVDVVSTPKAVLDFARMKIGGSHDEMFMVIFLNTKNHVLNWEIISSGTVDHAVIYPRNIIRRALSNNATGMIFVHNHPSSVCDPSQEDLDLTEAIRKAADAVNVRVLDHVIVGRSGYSSFVERGLL